MNVNMHRRKINAVYWPDTDPEQGRVLLSGDECGDLYLSATYHGDHDEFWIVQEKHGTEVARHNPKFVETIQWADAQQPNSAGAVGDPLECRVGRQPTRSVR